MVKERNANSGSCCMSAAEVELAEGFTYAEISTAIEISTGKLLAYSAGFHKSFEFIYQHSGGANEIRRH
jgi:hypothetical protein